MSKKGFIFDLDGVIVDTAHFHFLAWKNTAMELGFNLTEELNEQLKGVSRVNSLKKILSWANTSISQNRFEKLMHEKNSEYLTHIDKMSVNDVLAGVKDFLQELNNMSVPIALGSASKNATTILEKVQLIQMFDVIVDGNSVSKAKPDPEVFLTGAKKLNVEPQNCIVFEDAIAGIKAANSAGMTSIGIGNPKILKNADYVFNNFTEFEPDFIQQLVSQ